MSLLRAQVAVRLSGRLGNQLFQYAVCRVLQPPDLPVLVDVGMLNASRPYQLGGCLQDGAVRQLGRLDRVRLRGASQYRERVGDGFDPRVLDLKPPAILSGYFIGERYFAARAREVRAAFRPPSPAADRWIDECRERAGERPMVAIGFRHGDYVRHGYVLPSEYYRRAIASLLGEPRDYVWCVFGDDFNENLPVAREVIGAGTELLPAHRLGAVDQLMAMSHFDTLIIPNSTFSWWGAWLAAFDHPDRATILAPDPWVYLDNDYIPAGWTRVSRPGGLERAATGG